MPDTTDDNPQQNVTFPSNGTRAHGYLALPAGASGPGVVVIQEWWGLTTHIGAVADRLAADGFVALAPDLYGGTTTHDSDEAGRLMQSLPMDRAARDLAGAVDHLLAMEETTGDKVGVIGFCMGGAFVLTLAAQQGARVDAAVAFYPVAPSMPDLSGISAPVQLHLGTDDAFLDAASAQGVIDKITGDAASAPEVHRYQAGHAFFNDENLLGTYDPAAAALAWDRAVSFLRDHAA